MAPAFRKEWGPFDQLADEIDPHLYEVGAAVAGLHHQTANRQSAAQPRAFPHPSLCKFDA